ncbi:methyl-accepting chemotaxis protein [Anaerocolumna cellulosilytica]|uniref:Methyl-accepting chemotaxis protein n=1 Tax=Anaerocolumna cellulosilytica TaxID=433286 RepID=A0A6S6R8N1_9FIRM|nr:methyl-accepting chemotaxis protein [Anaerocolumna cellulosilytica]MBB5197896.1 methyl-accepting chemotaxis protein [Anaerocolumna cellulosilytica]BCJ95555.1 methyl-accepting chemotaxis protein [Anaerocolumna cellulosilytica]
MKIKWKIVSAVILALTGFILLTSISFHRIITKLVDDETLEQLGNYSELGLALLDANYPGEWRIEGENLYKGDTLINGNYDIVDQFTGNTGIQATLFAGDTRVSTTVIDDNGNRQTGTQASEDVIETVLLSNSDYIGSAMVAGKKADAYYMPIVDGSGTAIGMWFVGIYNYELEAKIAEYLTWIIVILLAVLVIGVLLSYLLGNSIAHGFNQIKNNMLKMEQGDLTIALKEKFAKRKDEVGDITRSFFQMQKQIARTMETIRTESQNIQDSTGILEGSAKDVYSDIENISATTEELSASMEETAASTQEIGYTAQEVEKEVGVVADKSNNGLQLAVEIKERADKLKAAALESQKNAVGIYEEANNQLRRSIERTSAIEEIRSLSKTILAITAQTNLLALNASIESARAGEAGKGFAVVANEIRLLAENSKAAVSKIEDITTEVANAVEELVEDSVNLLEFVDDKVIADYKTMVTTGEQYYRDASEFDEMVAEIKNSAYKLQESIVYIKTAIDEVTIATNEGATGASDIAEKATSIAAKTSDVLRQAQGNRESAVSLNEQIQFFNF